MPTTAFVIHFPNGDYEYDMRSADAPVIGDTVRRRGLLWKVTKRSSRDVVVTLEVEPVEGGNPTGHHARSDSG